MRTLIGTMLAALIAVAAGGCTTGMKDDGMMKDDTMKKERMMK